MLRRCHCRPSLLATDRRQLGAEQSRHKAVYAAPDELPSNIAKLQSCSKHPAHYSECTVELPTVSRRSGMHSSTARHRLKTHSTPSLHCGCACTQFRRSRARYACAQTRNCSSERAQLCPAATRSFTRRAVPHTELLDECASARKVVLPGWRFSTYCRPATTT